MQKNALLVGMKNGAASTENSLFLKKLNTELPNDPAILYTDRYTPKGTESRDLKRDQYLYPFFPRGESILEINSTPQQLMAFQAPQPYQQFLPLRQAWKVTYVN